MSSSRPPGLLPVDASVSALPPATTGGLGPRVSVLMPVYNSAPCLAEAIDSVLAQTYSDFEFVIVDDGSSDDSPRILRDYAAQDSRIRVITQRNGGIGAAMKTLIDESRAELVIFIDADDVMVAERVAVQVAYLDAHPELSAVGSQWFMASEKMEPLIIDTHSTDPDVSFVFSFAYQAIHNPTVCVRRSALTDVGGWDTNEPISGDTALYARMALSGHRYASAPFVLFLWRRSPMGVTHGRALAQTRRADYLRKAAFSELASRQPQRAEFVAKSILQTCPAGTWFDEKLRSLTGQADRSYLIDALPPDDSPEARLKRLIYRWFDAPESHSVELEQELRRQGQSIYAELLALNDGRAGPAMVGRIQPVARRAPQPATGEAGLTVYLPFDGNEIDLSERLACLQASGRPLKPCVFALMNVAPEALQRMRSLCADHRAATLSTELGWSGNLRQADSATVAYLLPGQRFDPGAFAAAVDVVTSGRASIACAALMYVYPYAQFQDAPGIEPKPTRSRSMSTLAGQRRLSLTSFVHRADVLEDCPLPLHKLGDAGAEEALQWFLTHHSGVQVVDGLHQLQVPDTAIRDNVLPQFHRHLVRNAFEGGLAVGETHAASRLSPEATHEVVRLLSQRHLHGQLLLHPTNAQRIVNAYGSAPLACLATRLGRDLMRGYPMQLRTALTDHGHARWASVCQLAVPCVRLGGRVRGRLVGRVGRA